jgi:hypothetical protein
MVKFEHLFTCKVAIAVALLATAGCTRLQPNATPTQHFDPALITQIEIEEGWSGMSPLSPVSSKLSLSRTSGGFEGVVAHSIGTLPPAPLTSTVPLSITSESLAPLLTMLATVPLSPGAYKPFFEHTDAYRCRTKWPTVQIRH